MQKSNAPIADGDVADEGHVHPANRKIPIALAIAACLFAVVIGITAFRQPDIVVTVDAVQVSGDELVITLHWDTWESIGFEITQLSSSLGPELSRQPKILSNDGMASSHWILEGLPLVRDWRRASGGPKTFLIPFNKNAPYTWHVQSGDVVRLRPGDELLLCNYNPIDPQEVMPSAVLKVRRR